MGENSWEESSTSCMNHAQSQSWKRISLQVMKVQLMEMVVEKEFTPRRPWQGLMRGRMTKVCYALLISLETFLCNNLSSLPRPSLVPPWVALCLWRSAIQPHLMQRDPEPIPPQCASANPSTSSTTSQIALLENTEGKNERHKQLF